MASRSINRRASYFDPLFFRSDDGFVAYQYSDCHSDPLKSNPLRILSFVGTSIGLDMVVGFAGCKLYRGTYPSIRWGSN